MQLHLGITAAHRGERARAETLLAQNLPMFRAVPWQRGLADALVDLGLIALRWEQWSRAATALSAALIIARTIGARIAITEALGGLPFLVAGSGNMWAAARLLGATASLRERLGAPIYPLRRPLGEQAEAAVQTALGEATFITEFRAGGTLLLEEAMDEVLVMCQPLMANPVVEV